MEIGFLVMATFAPMGLYWMIQEYDILPDGKLNGAALKIVQWKIAYTRHVAMVATLLVAVGFFVASSYVLLVLYPSNASAALPFWYMPVFMVSTCFQGVTVFLVRTFVMFGRQWGVLERS